MGVVGLRLTPRTLVDAVIRLGQGGDRFGLRRGGLSFSKLARQHPHGVVLADNLAPGVLRDVVVYGDRRVHLRHTDIENEVAALSLRTASDAYPLRMIGMRELHSLP